MQFETGYASHGSHWRGGHPESVSVLIDSRDRDPSRDPHPSSYRVAIPTLHDVSSARLVSAELPMVTYHFSAARQNTTLVVDDGTSVTTVIIEDGMYTVSTLVGALERAFVAAGLPDVRVTIDFATLVYTVTNGPDPVTIGDTELARLMGLDSPGSPARLVHTMYAVIRIRNLNYTTTTHRDGGNVFAKLPLKATAFQLAKVDRVLSVNRLNPVHRTLRWLDIEVSFRDRDGTERPVDGEHSLTLEFFARRLRDGL